MKALDIYIIEKFKINSKTVKNNDDSGLSQDIKDKISEELCRYFQGRFNYQGKKYENGLELIDQKFNKQICSLLDRTNAYKFLCDKIGIEPIEFVNYVEKNNDELYKEIKDFVL